MRSQKLSGQRHIKPNLLVLLSRYRWGGVVIRYDLVKSLEMMMETSYKKQLDFNEEDIGRCWNNILEYTKIYLH